MASRYWVGGNGNNWSTTGPTNWAATSGGAADETVPGVGDDVFLDASSGANTCNTSTTIKSLDMTGFANTFTHSASVNLQIGSAGQTGGICKFNTAGTMTYSRGSATTSDIVFGADGGTNVFTPGGNTFSDVTVNGAGSTVQLAGALTGTTTSTLTLTAGTLDTNGQAVSFGLFGSSNSNTRALTLGASTFTITATLGTVWDVTTGTNLTVTAGTSTIVFGGTPIGARSFVGGGKTYNNISGSQAAVPSTAFGLSNSGGQFNNVTLTGGNVITFNSMTITGTLDFQSSSSKHVRVASLTAGTSFTLTLSNNHTLGYLGISDMTRAGAGSLTVTEGLDFGGNSSITFSAHGGGGARVIGG